MTKTISQRIALVGSEEIRRQLAALGEHGEKAFRDIQAAAEKLTGPGATFARGMDAAERKLRELGSGFDALGKRMRNWGAGLSLGLTAPLAMLGRRSLDAWNAQAEAIGRVEAALASTGGVAGQTSEGLQAMAARFQEISTYGDEAVLAMQAVLLTFTNIRGERFEEATAAILDMSAALGTSLQAAAIQVGKALNDPVRGVSALAEAGIQYSEAQRETIRRMVEMGDVAGAQGLILKELRVQFGGMAAAMAATDTGQWTQAMNALGDAFEEVGRVIAPQVTALAQAIRGLAAAFIGLPDGVKTSVVAIGAILAVIGPVLTGIGLMVIGLGGIASGFASLIGVAARAAPLLALLATGFSGIATAMQGVLALVVPMLGWPVLLGFAIGALAVTVALHWDDIVATIGSALDAIGEAVRSSMAGIRAWVGDAFDWIRGKIGSVVDAALEKLRALKRLVSGVFGGGNSDAPAGGSSGTPGFAGGGRVRGPGTATSDSILARLSAGEFVVRAQAVRHYGADLFERLNALTMPRQLLPAFATGGLVPLRAETATGPAGGYATVNLTIGAERFGGLTAPRETAERLVRFATAEEARRAGRRPGWYGD